MTSDQLKIIQSMSQQERVAKYNKRLFLPPNDKLKITPNQLRQILELPYTGSVQATGDNPRPETGDSVAPVEPVKGSFGETLCKAFGGKIIEDKPVSQKAKLLNFLSDGLWHDTPSIISAVYGVGHQGVCRISERVRENIADGHQIESRKDSKTIWSYRLLTNKILI